MSPSDVPARSRERGDGLGLTDVRGVLLDLDDTVVDTARAMYAAGEVAIRAVWPLVDAQVAHDGSRRFRVDPGGFFHRYTRGELDFAQMRAARIGELAQHFGLSLPGQAHERFEAAYEPAFAATLAVFDDVEVLLRRCAELSLPVGVLTNSGGDYTARKLELVGCSARFAMVATRDTLGFGKPDRRVFTHACQLLGTAPAHTVYVGDELPIDAVGAHRAGLQALWLDRRSPSLHGGGGQAGEDEIPVGVGVVTDLAEVADLLG